jgi:hypothetical protein
VLYLVEEKKVMSVKAMTAMTGIIVLSKSRVDNV